MISLDDFFKNFCFFMFRSQKILAVFSKFLAYRLSTILHDRNNFFNEKFWNIILILKNFKILILKNSRFAVPYLI